MISTRTARPTAFLLTFLLTIAFCNPCKVWSAQPAPQSADSEQPGAEGPVRFSVEANSRLGLLTYVPGHWGDLQLRIENNADSEQNLLCSSYFGQQSTLQFGRQIWLPPNSRLQVAHPVLVPKVDQLSGEVAEVRSLVIDRSSGQEVLLKSEGGPLLHERSLLVSSPERNSGVIAGWHADESVPDDVMNLIIATRVNQGLNNQVSLVTGHFLPTDVASLNSMDHIVIMENRLLDDYAAMTAIRQWLHAGGRLWIMLDRVDPLLMEQLLGDDVVCHLVDRVGLTSVRIDTAPSFLDPAGKPGESVEYKEPIEFARVTVSGMKVRNTINGWPAAMTASYGEGRLLVTTLGASGWIKPTPAIPGAQAAAPSVSRLQNKESKFIPVSPMEDLAGYVMSKRADEPISREAMEALTQEFIAYEIPSWGLIIGIMVSFFFVLAVQGTWLWRTERMEHFGWIGSVTAVVFGIILTGIGVANRFGVPETAASLQIVQAIGGTDDVRSEGMIGIYRQEQVTTPIGTTAGGQFEANMSDQDGSTRRMITTDLGAYHWEGYAQPTGLRLYQSSSSKSLADRVSIEASLNAEGLVGQLKGLSELGTDTTIATQRGRLGVTVSGDGSLIALSENVLDAGQYIDAAFLGDVQDRRQRILKQLFENPNWRDSLNRPHLLAWLNHWDHGLQLGNELVQQGETLISVPFVLNRPADETEVLVPSPFISYSSCLAPDGSLPTGAWDDKLSEWQERSSESTTWLRFQIPQSLMPLKPTKARLKVKVSGDMGQFEILGAQDQSEFSLQVVNSPAGSLSFEIDNTDAIRLSPDGGLRLGIRAGRTAEAPAQPSAEMITNTTASYWQIESLSLELMATTTGQLAEE